MPILYKYINLFGLCIAIFLQSCSEEDQDNHDKSYTTQTHSETKIPLDINNRFPFHDLKKFSVMEAEDQYKQDRYMVAKSEAERIFGKSDDQQPIYYFSSQKSNKYFSAYTFVFPEDMGSGTLTWMNFDNNLKLIDEIDLSEGNCEAGLCKDTYTVFKNDSEASVITVELNDAEGVDLGDKVVDSITRKIDSTVQHVIFRYNGKIEKKDKKTFHREYRINNKDNVDVVGYPAPDILGRKH